MKKDVDLSSTMTGDDDIDLSEDMSADPNFDFGAAGWTIDDEGCLIPPVEDDTPPQ